MSADTSPGLPGIPARIAEYRLLGQIGRGRLSTVYLAEDERAGRSVALKLLVPALGQDAGFRTRFLRESEAAGTMGHPSIVPVYEVGAVGERLFIAMGYARGGNAGTLARQQGGRLAAARVWDILAQVASALDAAHSHGLVHGNVKPANILLDSGTDASHAYLSDFGMAAIPAGIPLPGTPSYDYTAPEQAAGRAADECSDLYSLACTGYTLLCGEPPFGRDLGTAGKYAQMHARPATVTALRPDLPAAIDLVLATALAKDPADRFATCASFAEALRIALGITAPPGQQGGLPGDDGEPSGWFGQPGQRPPDQPPMPSPDELSAATRRLSAARSTRQLPALPQDDSFPVAGLYREPAGPGSAGWYPERAEAYPEQPPDVPRQRGVSKRVLAATAVVVVVIGVVAGFALSGSPGGSGSSRATSPPSTVSKSSASAAGQATAISSLLSASASVRQSLSAAVGDVLRCSNVPAALSQLQAVVSRRRSEVSQASAQPTSALPDGAAVKSALLTALRDSLTADQDYLTWARQLSSGCKPGSQTGAYQTALGADSQATAAKGSFAQVWNPVAARYGLPQQSASSF